jgi:DNA-binding phage protein
MPNARFDTILKVFRALNVSIQFTLESYNQDRMGPA